MVRGGGVPGVVVVDDAVAALLRGVVPEVEEDAARSLASRAGTGWARATEIARRRSTARTGASGVDGELDLGHGVRPDLVRRMRLDELERKVVRGGAGGGLPRRNRRNLAGGSGGSGGQIEQPDGAVLSVDGGRRKRENEALTGRPRGGRSAREERGEVGGVAPCAGDRGRAGGRG
jgi:hypothetical protein